MFQGPEVSLDCPQAFIYNFMAAYWEILEIIYEHQNPALLVRVHLLMLGLLWDWKFTFVWIYFLGWKEEKD